MPRKNNSKEASDNAPVAVVQGLGTPSPENTKGPKVVELDGDTVREDY